MTSLSVYYLYLPYETGSIKSPICTEQPGAFLFTAINESFLGVLGLTSKFKTTSWELKTPTFNDGNPSNGHISPYYWGDDHLLVK